MIDWAAIKAEYETGESLRSLAVKHGISKSLIGKHKYNEQWTSSVDKRLSTAMDTPPIPRPRLLVPRPITSVFTIADTLLGQVSEMLQGDDLLPMRDLKSASDVLAACAKVKFTSPQEQDTKDGLVIPLDKLSAKTRMEIRRLLAEDEQQRTQQERREAAG